ncbi:ribosomal protein S18-alanine N-acetyltransferase [Leifsonia sp. Root112D2]|uniref:ribosomal protein S18-alanine N-acetyltransferase n=1 Tax=Leifsonia sp. Root112D2 TaxID=1736426 RepID=UPI0006F60435|nr:ribosomal protein S18-alanine N-acetyltransferase [Leifsonia sp. Root112D2]KQV07215.1 ribosomal-protein-alanine acetyltransferase [Leifsonia sp. Root112D2]
MSGHSWQMRRATEADLEAIMLLESSIFASDAWSSETMRGELGNPHAYYLVAFEPENPDAIAGYAGLLAPRGAPESDIQTIAVDENARRHGLGRALIGSLVGEARRRGAKEIFLEVRADNPGAQRLYAEFGFEELGVRRGYYQPDNVDAIVMRLLVTDPATALAVGSEVSP